MDFLKQLTAFLQRQLEKLRMLHLEDISGELLERILR